MNNENYKKQKSHLMKNVVTNLKNCETKTTTF